MLLGCGTDIVLNSRFLGKTDDFFRKLFNDAELNKIAAPESLLKKAETAGSLFALKEAVSKALGFSLFDIGIKSITIENDQNGKPNVKLNPSLLKQVQDYYKIDAVNIFASLSHEKEYSVAFAVFEGIL